MTNAAGRIAVLSTVKEAFSVAAGSFVPAVSITGLPLIAALAAVAAGEVSGNPFYVDATFAAFALVLLCCVWAATIVSQAKAMGVPVPASPGSLFLKARFWRYGAASILCSLIPAAVLVPAVSASRWSYGILGGTREAEGIAAVLLLAGIAGSLYVGLRLFLVLPAMAAGQPFSLGKSWRLTAGNVLPLGASNFLCILPVGVLQSVAQWASEGAEGLAAKVAGGFAVLLASVVQATLVGSVGGVACRRLAA